MTSITETEEIAQLAKASIFSPTVLPPLLLPVLGFPDFNIRLSERRLCRHFADFHFLKKIKTLSPFFASPNSNIQFPPINSTNRVSQGRKGAEFNADSSVINVCTQWEFVEYIGSKGMKLFPCALGDSTFVPMDFGKG